MRAMTRSLHLIDAKLRDDKEANRLFLEILTSKNDPETVLRRMNEAGVLGRFVPAFGKVVAMMQFNMYHHYTVDEHLLRCIGMLTEMERGSGKEAPLAHELLHKLQPGNRTLLYVTMFLHDIAKAASKTTRSPAPGWRGGCARGWACRRPTPRRWRG